MIGRYGGVVEKFIGDAVMAVWGTPVAAEGDAERAERAVRAALDLVGAVADMGAEAGPGEHFGELAARDWGGGYGYARTATVQCAQDGQLLQLSSDDFQWLVQTQPAARTELAKVLADRLRQR